MFTEKHNQNLLNDVMKILGNKDANKDINPTPQWIVEAAQVAAQDIREYMGSGSILTSETRRDILRNHLKEAVLNCKGEVTNSASVLFDKAVEKCLAEGAMPTQKAAIATPKEVAKKTAKPASKPLPANGGIVGKTAKEEIESDMRDFLSQLTTEEIDILRGIITE
jgi:hypothetical protein